MANYLYFDGTPMPICPSELTMTINNRNETLDLVNGHEINIIKKAGLTEIECELLIPGVKYPFAYYDGGIFLTPSHYLGLFETLKADEKPFQFIVTRTRPNGDIYWDTNITVSLEDYEIKETTDEGPDVIVGVKLKQYRHYGTKKITISADGTLVMIVGNNRLESKGAPKTYTVKEGDTLWRICRSILGDESKFEAVARANAITEPNDIAVGMVLKLDV